MDQESKQDKKTPEVQGDIQTFLSNKVLEEVSETRRPEIAKPASEIVPKLESPKKDVPRFRVQNLKNIETGNVTTDNLQRLVARNCLCTTNYCKGSIMATTPFRPHGTLKPLEEAEAECRSFLDQFFSFKKRQNSAEHLARVKEALEGLRSESQTYKHTYQELIFGAKAAWRNASRCIGRIQWSKLQVFDARDVSSASEMFEAMCQHLRYATNKGNLRSTITLFPPRMVGQGDFKVWNSQLVSFAGYRDDSGEIIGDPKNVEFTDICRELGWQPPNDTPSRFDVLPLVLQANGERPEWFALPDELVMLVDIVHPKYEWFKELGIKWYAIPAVANMMLDCGGIEYTGAPFNGWYMVTEIGTRDLCDTFRYNILEDVGIKMGLDTRTDHTLWRDQACLEVNIAILHSFEKESVTIMDHHTASKSFMKHLSNEDKLRGGCPADWVWIVPPLSGSLTPVFHQEMLNYFLKPSYDYQVDPWKIIKWRDVTVSERRVFKPDATPRQMFKAVTRAVLFTSGLYSRIIAKRVKVSILYATETGVSEGYARRVGELFRMVFKTQLFCMEAYDIADLPYESLVIFVASTFGNGDPPENGEAFSHNLKNMKESQEIPGLIVEKPKAALFVRESSQTENVRPYITRQKSTLKEESLLCNVRYSVFALGSSAYPNFCAFGLFLDNTMEQLGAARLVVLEKGDEMCGQEQSFNKWLKKVFLNSCQEFSIELDDNIKAKVFEVKKSSDRTWQPSEYRLDPFPTGPRPLAEGLSPGSRRPLYIAKAKQKKSLHPELENYKTVLLELDTLGEAALSYEPGDHVGVYPENEKSLVDGILSHLKARNPDKAILLMEQFVETSDSPPHPKSTSSSAPQDEKYKWQPSTRLPPCTLREAFTYYLDITSVLMPHLLAMIAQMASDSKDKERLKILSTNSVEYANWKEYYFPHLLEVIAMFPSVQLSPEFLLVHLPLMQARFYSISSSELSTPSRIALTVSVVSFRTQNNTGPLHYGVCSNFLSNLKPGKEAIIFVKKAVSFHLPTNQMDNVMMVGPGTGIAPFRSFWQHRQAQKQIHPDMTFGKMVLFVGARNPECELYREETEKMKQEKVISDVLKAYSRIPGQPKIYVQQLMTSKPSLIKELLVVKKAHLYVCGDTKMAQDVLETLKGMLHSIVQEMSESERYHEDVFGITFHIREVTRSALNKSLSFSQDKI